MKENNNKKSPFNKWLNKQELDPIINTAQNGWNAACKSILNKIKYKEKMFGREYGWQHEDIDYLIEDIKEMIEKE